MEEKKRIKGSSGHANGLVYAIGDHIWFYDVVTESSALEFNTLLHKIAMTQGSNTMNSMHEFTAPPPIWIHINTPGGHVIDGLAMYDTIARIAETTPVAIIIEGMAASMGAIIAQAGSQRYIRKHSTMLIHQVTGGHFGPLDKLEESLMNTKMLNDALKGIILEKTKLPKATLEDLFKKDLYLNAKKCKRFGLVDEII